MTAYDGRLTKPAIPSEFAGAKLAALGLTPPGPSSLTRAEASGMFRHSSRRGSQGGCLTGCHWVGAYQYSSCHLHLPARQVRVLLGHAVLPSSAFPDTTKTPLRGQGSAKVACTWKLMQRTQVLERREPVLWARCLLGLESASCRVTRPYVSQTLLRSPAGFPWNKSGPSAITTYLARL